MITKIIDSNSECRVKDSSTHVILESYRVPSLAVNPEAGEVDPLVIQIWEREDCIEIVARGKRYYLFSDGRIGANPMIAGTKRKSLGTVTMEGLTEEDDGEPQKRIK